MLWALGLFGGPVAVLLANLGMLTKQQCISALWVVAAVWVAGTAFGGFSLLATGGKHGKTCFVLNLCFAITFIWVFAICAGQANRPASMGP